MCVPALGRLEVYGAMRYLMGASMSVVIRSGSLTFGTFLRRAVPVFRPWRQGPSCASAENNTWIHDTSNYIHPHHRTQKS